MTIRTAEASTLAPRTDNPPSIRSALACLSLSMLLSSLGTSIANVALPTLATAFHAAFGEVQWIVLAYLLAITTLIVSVGRLGDLIGRRRLMLAGIGLFSAASLACAVAPTLALLIAARAAQGLGAAIMMALSMALVADAVPKEKTGSAMGLLGTMSAIGTALGPSLGGVLIAGFGWRSIFFVTVPLGALALALSYRALPQDRPKTTADRPGFDALGTLLLALTLAAYALAMTIGRGHFGLVNLTLLIVAGAGLGVFGRVQSHAQSPLIRLAMLREPGLRAGLVVGLLVATVMMATLVVGPFYLARGLGLDAATVGMVMSLGPILSAFSGILGGRIVDRFGAPGVVVAGLAVMAVGSLGLTLLPGLFGLSGYIAAIAVLTPGYQAFQAANNTAVMADIRADQRGVISGLINLSRNLGLITGASVMGAVFAFASGAVDITTAPAAAVAAGLGASFAVATALIAAALAIVVASRAGAARPSRQSDAVD